MNGKRYFVIADLHFGHEKIIDYCKRPFKNIFDMNKTLVKNWNKAVRKDDVVFVLGDVALRKNYVKEYVPKLNGKKILVKGNHDSASNEFYRQCGFKEVSDYPILFDFCLMSHEPLPLSETTPYFNFYGHVHNDEKFVDTETSKCVSVERIGYAPYCFYEKNNS